MTEHNVKLIALDMDGTLLTIYLSKLFKANSQIALLLGIGTGVCGAAAIAAVAPICKGKRR